MSFDMLNIPFTSACLAPKLPHSNNSFYPAQLTPHPPPYIRPIARLTCVSNSVGLLVVSYQPLQTSDTLSRQTTFGPINMTVTSGVHGRTIRYVRTQSAESTFAATTDRKFHQSRRP